MKRPRDDLWVNQNSIFLRGDLVKRGDLVIITSVYSIRGLPAGTICLILDAHPTGLNSFAYYDILAWNPTKEQAVLERQMHPAYLAYLDTDLDVSELVRLHPDLC